MSVPEHHARRGRIPVATAPTAGHTNSLVGPGWRALASEDVFVVATGRARPSCSRR